MTSTHHFDYDAFVQGYRTACAARGIDPAQGATGYQVVHVVTEGRHGHTDRWWQRHTLWLNCPPYVSDTEREAIWNVFSETYGIMAARIARAARLHRAALSLRELHELRAGGKKTG
ncbi:MAG TPA: hypothetical protein VHD90_10795 [Phototrophicaceae bacterium]|nr:hypothetical protein [Phototrophicaceae bacterium]